MASVARMHARPALMTESFQALNRLAMFFMTFAAGYPLALAVGGMPPLLSVLLVW